jgi:hypothetical protein
MMDIKESDQILYLINYGRDLEREVKGYRPGFIFLSGFLLGSFIGIFAGVILS